MITAASSVYDPLKKEHKDAFWQGCLPGYRYRLADSNLLVRLLSYEYMPASEKVDI